MHPVAADAPHGRAIRALHGLLSRIRLDFVFVGGVARAAHLGDRVESGAVDVVATMGPQQKSQIAMMAMNNGFTVDREEVDAAEELDLIPMRFEDLRVHVLVASNALYGRMVAEGVAAEFEDLTLRVPRREDFALLLQMSNDVEALMRTIESPEFDVESYNRKLSAIGLREYVVPS